MNVSLVHFNILWSKTSLCSYLTITVVITHYICIFILNISVSVQVQESWLLFSFSTKFFQFYLHAWCFLHIDLHFIVFGYICFIKCCKIYLNIFVFPTGEIQFVKSPVDMLKCYRTLFQGQLFNSIFLGFSL